MLLHLIQWPKAASVLAKNIVRWGSIEVEKINIGSHQSSGIWRSDIFAIIAGSIPHTREMTGTKSRQVEIFIMFMVP
ncbi:hypothetical protein [Membranihabitans maritimus]|uniref:hypothetical protein n=1 Tax=Membranihabitans maritimus TaxID=2904244 RepID=UPI001F2CD009|nr:hypothetical protein [Membranihabitans maritimus]